MNKIVKYKQKSKLVIGFIYKDEAIFLKAKEKLRKKFGKVDFISEPLEFNHTDYYQAEMGDGLKRRFVSFAKFIPMQDLYRIKLYTSRLETKFRLNKLRQVNIDPGYLDLAKLVLATTKDYAHRIFLRKGIFAEIALCFRGNAFSANEWTYTDYRSKEYIDIFNQIRKSFAP